MRFKVGDIVYNETFGLGKVLGITEYGKDNYLNIRFHTPRQSGIQSIRENDNSVFSTILYEAVKEIKNRDNVTVSDIREFIRQRFNNALINKTCAISDDIRTFCEEFSLNESFVIDCIKKNNQENLSKKIKLELKEGYISLKDLENLYEDNKLIIDYASLENLVKQHNLEFMKNELQKYPDVFQIEGFVLDDEQKQAVVSDEINALVVAGAGCGKTSMLISKVAYLLQKGVSQEEILLISYTNKTVDDLRERLAKFTSIEPMTIHSFCKNVILNERKRCDKQLLYKVIESIKSGKSNFLKDFYRVILEYLGLYSDIGSDFNKFATSFNAKKTCAQYENDKKYDTLASIIKNFEQKNTTVKGDKVKSLAEAQIANFLFLNNIKYEYELEYTKEYYGKTNDASKSYHPDFHIHTPKNMVVTVVAL